MLQLTKTPDIGAGRELSKCNGLWSSPADRDLASPGGVGAIDTGVADLSAIIRIVEIFMSNNFNL